MQTLGARFLRSGRAQLGAFLTGGLRASGLAGRGEVVPAVTGFNAYASINPFLTGAGTVLPPQASQLANRNVGAALERLASTPPLVFDGGGMNAIGGLEGISDQTLAAGVDLAGMR